MTQRAGQHEPASSPPRPSAQTATVAYASSRRPRKSHRRPLIVVLVLLGVLSAIVPPIVTRGVRFTHEVTCSANLNRIGQAVMIYRTANQDMCPPDLDATVRENLAHPNSFVCPATGTMPPAADYIYTPLPAGARWRLVCAFELPANHRQRTACVLDTAGNVSERRDTYTLLSDLQALNNYLAERRSAGGGAP